MIIIFVIVLSIFYYQRMWTYKINKTIY